jgi:hypothetical protein
MGISALANNTTASNNTAVGYQAGYNNTAVGNTFIGYQAGITVTSGTYNVALGAAAGPQLSTATGTGNIYLGSGAGASLTTGTYNTFVGPAGQVNQGPGGLITTGSKNTLLGGYNGNQGGLDIRTASNYIVLSDGDGNPRGIFDNGGNFLVGTTATVSAGPTSRVISYAGSASTAAISAQYGNSYTGQLYRADSLTTSGTGWSYFMGLSGNGTSITTTQIQILGNGNIQNTNNSYGAISDIKRKENITDATPKLEKLNQVRVVNFNMIGEEQKQLGVIAQELEQVFPSMIEETPDRDVEGNDLGTTTKSVKYSVFVPMLIKAIQELKAEVDSLKAQINGA